MGTIDREGMAMSPAVASPKRPLIPGRIRYTVKAGDVAEILTPFGAVVVRAGLKADNGIVLDTVEVQAEPGADVDGLRFVRILRSGMRADGFADNDNAAGAERRAPLPPKPAQKLKRCLHEALSAGGRCVQCGAKV